MQPRNEHKMWNPWKKLMLHNSREMLARLLYRRIRHLCTTYKMQNVWAFYPKYAIYVWFPVFLTRWSKMIKYDTIWYIVMHYDTMLWLLLTSSLFTLFLCLKAYSFSCMATLRNAQTKIAIVYMREQTFGTWDDMMIPIWYGMYAMEGVDH